MEGAKQCPHCTSWNPPDVQFCVTCSHPFVASPYQSQPNNPYAHYPRGPQPVYQQPGIIQVPAGSHPVALVVVLSVLFGGWVGMLINRQIAKGLIYGLVVYTIVSMLTCGVGWVILYPLTLIDAIMVANRLNRGEAIRDWQFF